MKLSKQFNIKSKKIYYSMIGGLAAGIISLHTVAATAQYFEIDEQPLGAALKAYASQVGVQLMFAEDEVSNLKTQGVSGEFTRELALQKILQNSGLVFEFAGENVVVVKQGPAMQNGQGSTALEGGRKLEHDKNNKLEIEEMIVTAAKRKTSLQDTAMSISAISSESIDKRGLVGMDDFLRSLPGVSYQDRGAGQNSIVMRGISTSPQTDNGAVGVYFGEIPVAGLSNAGNGGGGGNADVKLVDIERIEVLRGPQGTLYGSGSMGGTVRAIPKAPNLQNTEGNVAARYSNTGGKGGNNSMVQGALSIPLVENKLAVRAVAYQFENSGYIENVAARNDVPAGVASARNFGGIAVNRDDVGSDEYTGFRIAALWQPTDSFDMTLTYINQEIDQTGWPEVNLTMGEFEQARLKTRFDRGEYLNADVEIVNLDVNFNVPWGTFTSSTSVIDYDQTSSFDLSFFLGLPMDAAGHKQVDSFIEELRFSSNFDGPAQVLAGIYYEDRETSRNFNNQLTSEPEFQDDLIALLVAPPLPDTFFNNDYLVEDILQKAVFGELSYDLTEQLTATLGGRYFRYELDAPYVSTGTWFPNATIPGGGKKSGSTYKVNLSYKTAGDNLIYGQWAQGFRLGAPQTPGLMPMCDADGNGLAELPDGSEIAIPDSVDPDELENFELGFKTSFADSRVTFNTAIYRINWEGMPVQTTLACSGGAIINAGKAKSEGVELEARILLLDNLLLDLATSFTETTLAEDAPGLGVGAVSGANLPGSADFNFSAALEYGFALANSDAFFRVDYSYIGEYFGNFTETGQKSGDYHMVNLKLGTVFDQFNVDLFVNNLTDADEFTWAENLFAQFGFARAYQLRPRTVGLNVGYHF